MKKIFLGGLFDAPGTKQYIKNQVEPDERIKLRKRDSGECGDYQAVEGDYNLFLNTI